MQVTHVAQPEGLIQIWPWQW